ncbi:MAG: DUF1538 domain-containing protein [Pseudomonadales bacterium]
MIEQTNPHPRFTLGWRDTLRVLWPYVKRNFLEQVNGIWFIVVYLLIFQLLVLQLPIVFAAMIGAGIFVVAIGLMFFMEGLRLGLMPLGEAIGTVLPRNSKLPVILLFAFLLGVGATFAEPAIAVLKAAGSGVVPSEAPLLFSLLNDFSSQLVSSVGVGVGLAVLLGVLRFFYGWSLKTMVIPAVSSLLALSLYFSQVEHLRDVLGLAWDCGAVTTGPVTVPLVLALGIGVCRVVSHGSSNNAGFGIVTLASLFPILAVLLLSLYHYAAQDYYGAEHYRGKIATTQSDVSPAATAKKTAPQQKLQAISVQEYEAYLNNGVLPADHSFRFVGGDATLREGRIVLDNPQVIIEQVEKHSFTLLSDELWDSGQSLASQAWQACGDALRAIVPLCLFLFFVLRIVLRQTLHHAEEVRIGVCFALVGMTLFGLGIALGLTPLGSQLGSNVPATFAQITPWGSSYAQGPIFSDGHAGKLVAIVFAFFLGYGATLAEPALNALGVTVEKITVGAFRKKMLMQSVAIGVGFGIAAGICKIAYNLPLIWMLIPPYAVVLVLTWFSPEDFVNFGWDSAGVTTGPITVPLVLAMGLGIGGNIPGVTDGFGILALASVGPILTVLTVGLITTRSNRLAEGSMQDEQPQETLNTLKPVVP